MPVERESLTATGAIEAAGAVLFKERRRQGLSLGDVSRQLKLSVRQVEALERDDYTAYKSPVFIHGFIRNYAKLLGLDPEPLIRTTDSMLGPSLSQSVPSGEPNRMQTARHDGRNTRLWVATAVVLLAGIAIAVYYGGRRAADAGRASSTLAARDKPAVPLKNMSDARTGADASSKVDPKQETGASSVAVATATAKPEPKVDPKQDKKAESRVDTKQEKAPESKPVKTPTPKPPEVKSEARNAGAELPTAVKTPASVSSDQAAKVTIRMVFEQESWVEIKDRSGTTIFGQLNHAGTRRSVTGELPMSVVVGNAVGVRLFQGDKSIDLAPHTRVDVARLKLE